MRPIFLTPISLSELAARFDFPGSCCGKVCLVSFTLRMSIGPPSGESISYGRCAPISSAKGALGSNIMGRAAVRGRAVPSSKQCLGLEARVSDRSATPAIRRRGGREGTMKRLPSRSISVLVSELSSAMIFVRLTIHPELPE